MKGFENGFMLGAATAAHQVEGNNIHSDFWAMEQANSPMFKEPSLDSVDHYNRFKEDIDLLADAGLNAYRFSIEWARIEPHKDAFDKKELQHYREVLQYCKDKDVTPIVTMHHFTSPKWLIESGGWEADSTIDYFAKYCGYVAEELGDLMEYVCTINEANMGLQLADIIKERAESMRGDVQVGVNSSGQEQMAAMMATLSKVFGGIDPRSINIFLSGRTESGDLLIMRAHEKARDTMKAICPHLNVGITLSVYEFQALPGGEERTHAEYDKEFLHYLPYIKNDDFFGLQNYTRKIIGADGVVPPPIDSEKTQMGYEFYPKALEGVIRYVSKHIQIPIIVTENGIATSDDQRRVVFIEEALEGIKSCISDGIPVKGYMHWSLLDNFEWMLGYEITFGLIAVDRKTQKRYPKESLKVLGSYAKH